MGCLHSQFLADWQVQPPPPHCQLTRRQSWTCAAWIAHARTARTTSSRSSSKRGLTTCSRCMQPCAAHPLPSMYAVHDDPPCHVKNGRDGSQPWGAAAKRMLRLSCCRAPTWSCRILPCPTRHVPFPRPAQSARGALRTGTALPWQCSTQTSSPAWWASASSRPCPRRSGSRPSWQACVGKARAALCRLSWDCARGCCLE